MGFTQANCCHFDLFLDTLTHTHTQADIRAHTLNGTVIDLGVASARDALMPSLLKQLSHVCGEIPPHINSNVTRKKYRKFIYINSYIHIYINTYMYINSFDAMRCVAMLQRCFSTSSPYFAKVKY